MACSMCSKFSPCGGNITTYKIIENNIIKKMESKKSEFNMTEVKRLSEQEIEFCVKHHKQHNQLLIWIINRSILFKAITHKNVDALTGIK